MIVFVLSRVMGQAMNRLWQLWRNWRRNLMVNEFGRLIKARDEAVHESLVLRCAMKRWEAGDKKGAWEQLDIIKPKRVR
jgi:hypothetical protein